MALMKTTDSDVSNENLPPALVGVATRVYDIAVAHGGAWWAPLVPTLKQAHYPTTPFSWRDNARLLHVVSSDGSAAKPRFGVSPNHLELGYGAGLTSSSSGAMEADGGATIIYGANVAWVSVFRVASGLPNGGGTLIGNMVAQTDRSEIDVAANFRFSGLQLGYGATSTTELRLCHWGDTIYLNPPGSRNDMDGLWHVAIGIFDDAAQTLTLRIDGVVIATVSTHTSVDHGLTQVAGGRSVRIGANGGPGAAAASLTNRFVGDIGDQMALGGAPLSSGEIATIEAYLIGIYR